MSLSLEHTINRGSGEGSPLPRPPRTPYHWLPHAINGSVTLAIAVMIALIVPATASAAADWSTDTGATVYAVATSADGTVTVAGRRDNTVVAYDDAGGEKWSFATNGTVYDVAISDDGSAIAIASEDRNVYLLDGDGNVMWQHRGPQTFLSVSITGDGSIVAAGSQDGTATAFDDQGNVEWEHAATDQVQAVALYGGSGGYRALIGTQNSRVTLLGGDGNVLWEQTLSYGIRALSVTVNGAKVAVGDNEGTLYLLDGASGATLWDTTFDSAVLGADISANGETIIAGTEGGRFSTFTGAGEQVQSATIDGGFFDVALNGNTTQAAVAVDEQVATYPRDASGAFQVPEPASLFSRYALPVAAALAVVVAVVLALGLRRTSTGERAWQVTARRRGSTLRDVRRAWISYVFLLPTIALLLVFSYYPAFSGIFHAFTEWTPGAETRWVGLQQFRDLADNHYFWAGIVNLLIFIVTGFLKLLIPLAVAEMIFHLRSSRAQYAFRTLFVLQVIVPGVVGVLLWVNIYDPNIGLANQILRAAGLDDLSRYWLGDASTAIWAIVFMGFPWVSAFALLIFYGGLISIPGDLFDATALDGASTLRRIVDLDLPLLLGQVRLLLILTFIAMVQEFAAVYLTTGGGPGSSTYLPSLELYYQAVRFNNFGGASAIGAVLFIIILGGTILNLRYVKSSVEYST